MNLVDGKQTWEQIADHDDDLETMKKCCATELATYREVGLVPAPYYFHRVAVLARKAADFETEVQYCETYISVVDEYYREHNLPETEGVKMGTRYRSIAQRLPKARTLLGKEATGKV